MTGVSSSLSEKLRPGGRGRASLTKIWETAPSKKALDKVAFLQSKGVVGYNKKKS